jgi:hypothetical protein
MIEIEPAEVGPGALLLSAWRRARSQNTWGCSPSSLARRDAPERPRLPAAAAFGVNRIANWSPSTGTTINTDY